MCGAYLFWSFLPEKGSLPKDALLLQPELPALASQPYARPGGPPWGWRPRGREKPVLISKSLLEMTLCP